jgi:metal-responsive CopG/Arc/MetJ family transcriptional regulator
MPKPLKFPTKILIGVHDELLAAIDKWRRQQEDLPTRSEAIRRLVAAVLDKDPGKKTAKRR